MAEVHTVKPGDFCYLNSGNFQVRVMVENVEIRPVQEFYEVNYGTEQAIPGPRRVDIQFRATLIDSLRLTEQEALALAVLRGDTVAALALADLIQERHGK